MIEGRDAGPLGLTPYRALLAAGSVALFASLWLPTLGLGARSLSGWETALTSLQGGAERVFGGGGARLHGLMLLLAAGLNVCAPWWAVTPRRWLAALLAAGVVATAYLTWRLLTTADASLFAGFFAWCAGVLAFAAAPAWRSRA